MSISLNLSQEDVDRFVRDALSKTLLAGTIEKALSSALTGGYNNPVDAALKGFIQDTISTILHTEPYKTKIETAVRTALEERLSDTFIKEKAESLAYKISRGD